MMDFEWDDDKNEANAIKHGFDFERAITIFNGVTLDWEDTRKNYGEKRTISLGLMGGVVIIAMVHTDRHGKKRIISARQAKLRERRIYEIYKTEVERRTAGYEG